MSPEQASVVELQDVIRWKNNLQVGEDELQEMRVPTSSLYIGETRSRASVIGMTPLQRLQQHEETLHAQPASSHHVTPPLSSSLKSPGVTRRATTTAASTTARGMRPKSAPFGRHSTNTVNRTTSLQHPNSSHPKHVSLTRGDLYLFTDSSDQDSLYAAVAPPGNNNYTVPPSGGRFVAPSNSEDSLYAVVAPPLNDSYTIPSGGAHIVAPPRERYVPLTTTTTPRNQDLPESLQHIDLNAFKENLPQGYQVQNTPGNQNHPNPLSNGYHDDQYYYVDQYGNPVPQYYATYVASQESLADSGIVPTQGSPNYSQNGFSPHMGVNNRITPIQETIEEQAKDSRKDLSHAKSMPNLQQDSSDDDNLLPLTRMSIENVMNSDLTSEEKLDVMAAMCEGNNTQGRKGVSRVPSHVWTALRKIRIAENNKKGDATINSQKQRDNQSVRPKSSLYHRPQPPAYQTLPQRRRPLSAQEVPPEVPNQPESRTERMYGSVPTVHPPIYRIPVNIPRDQYVTPHGVQIGHDRVLHDGIDIPVRYSHPYLPLHPSVKDATIAHHHPYLLPHHTGNDTSVPYPHPHLPPYPAMRYRILTADSTHAQNKLPNLAPVHDAPTTADGATYDILDALPPVLIPVTEAGASQPPGTRQKHHDVTTESETTTETVDTEQVRPLQKGRHSGPAQWTGSRLPYGIDIEQWVSQQQEAGAGGEQVSPLGGSTDLGDTSDEYNNGSKANRDR